MPRAGSWSWSPAWDSRMEASRAGAADFFPPCIRELNSGLKGIRSSLLPTRPGLHPRPVAAHWMRSVTDTRLTYRYQGRDFRLTDVAGKVANKLLA